MIDPRWDKASFGQAPSLDAAAIEVLFNGADVDRSGSLNFDEVCAMVRQHRVFEVQSGRLFVAISLAEAGLRALLHARSDR